MINYKTIELSTGAKAVEAKYIDTGLGQYSNNPLIEALPKINERDDVPGMIVNYPKIKDKKKKEAIKKEEVKPENKCKNPCGRDEADKDKIDNSTEKSES